MQEINEASTQASSSPIISPVIQGDCETEKLTLRLSKLMSERGLCSRREADDLIARGWVKVDGEIVKQLGTQVTREVKIELATKAKEKLQSSVTILMNKPVGFVSGQPEGNYQPAVRLITTSNQDIDRHDEKLRFEMLEGLAPAGRLDIDSQGLLVFTSNGTVAKLLIGENSEVEKEYLVRVRGHLSHAGLKLLNHGLRLDDQELRPARVEWVNDDQLRFVLREGRKRQIRRMCELVDLEVEGLKRVRIGDIRLGRLPEGKWRFLRRGEAF